VAVEPARISHRTRERNRDADDAPARGPACAPAATVLVVDDEPHVRSALVRTLRRSVRRILLAGVAEEAERLVVQHDVDLVLADHGLPGTTGLELLRRLRARGLRARRLLITGHADDRLDAAALAHAGVARLIPKPWDPDALRELVTALVCGAELAPTEAARARADECAREASDAWLARARSALAAPASATAAIAAACDALTALADDAEISFFDERSEQLHVFDARSARLSFRALAALDDDELAALGHARSAAGPLALQRVARRDGKRTALLARVRARGRALGVLQVVSAQPLEARPEAFARIAALAAVLGLALARASSRRDGAASA